MLSILAIVALLQIPSPSPAPGMEDAYLDAQAASMVAAARARGAGANEEISGYSMVATQRISVGIRALRRDRTIFRRELSTAIEWRREGGARQIDILGARQAVPIAKRGVERPDEDDFVSGSFDLSVDPAGEWLLRIPRSREDEEDDDDESIVHPLAPGSEEHYRFRTGETTTIRLADGLTLRLIELQVLPRRSRSDLITGSLWLDADTHAAVRGVFTLAAPFTVDASDEESAFLPLPDISLSLGYITVEYGLWDGTWWLPRLVAVEGTARVGSITVPAVIEQRYSDYQVYSTTAPPLEAPDSTRFRILTRECPGKESCTRRIVLVPHDGDELLENEYLPGSLFDGRRLVTESELRATADLVSASSWRGMLHRTPRWRWRPLDASLIHYNRVEGLTLGTRGTIDLEPLSLFGQLWVGTVDLSPGARVSLTRSLPFRRESIEMYRRLEAFAPVENPFSFGSSFSAFAFGHDDGDYYRTTGAALTLNRWWGGQDLQIRLYGERHSSVQKGTDTSIPNWLEDRIFRANPPADEAEQFGTLVEARAARGEDPLGFRTGVVISLQAEHGSYRLAKPSAIVHAGFPLPGPFVGALEASAGTSFGELPVQRLWYIGGSSTVRGFRAEERLSGSAFWYATAEVGTDLPAARIVAFTDLGWAGSRHSIANTPGLVSVGAGVSFLDGLFRADLTRAMRGGDRWGFQLHLDAPL